MTQHAEGSMPYSGRCDHCTIIFETGMRALRELTFEEWWDALDVSTSDREICGTNENLGLPR